jgi:hypothetical protein
MSRGLRVANQEAQLLRLDWPNFFVAYFTLLAIYRHLLSLSTCLMKLNQPLPKVHHSDKDLMKLESTDVGQYHQSATA